MKNIHIHHHIETELLIVGSGIAGLSACVEAEEKGIKATLITKSKIGSGASFFPLKATLGIQVTGGEADYSKFQEDIERVAQGMNNPKIVKAYIEDSAQAIDLLDKIGFRAWKRNDNRPACFAKYPRPIYLINNWKKAAERATEIIQQQSTQVYENATLLYIAVADNQVQGAVFSYKTSGEIQYIFCKTSQLILATGGIAGLYRDNLYPQDVVGSTHFIAKQAGASFVNLEFIQFIPSFIEPKYKVLFGEHTLKYVRKVTDEQGRDLFSHLEPHAFQKMMLERSHYAPFSIDFECVEFDLQMMKYLLENPEQKGVYLEYQPELYQDKEEFYVVYLNWLKNEVGIDLLTDKIAIAPFAHSCNGGVEIDEFAQSRVQGLFAVGEISSCIEGANRLGGNSVGGGLVFARRAVKQIAENLQKAPQKLPLEQLIYQSEQALNALANADADKTLSAGVVLSTIREKMAKYANVYRTKANLLQLQNDLLDLETRFDPIEWAEYNGIEVYNALKTAQMVVSAMLAREKSLGSHYRAN